MGDLNLDLCNETVEPLGDNLANRTQRDSSLRNGWIGRFHQGAPRHQPVNDQDSHRDPGADYDRRKMQASRDEIDEINRIQALCEPESKIENGNPG